MSAPTAPPIPAEMDDHPVSRALSWMWDGHDVWGSAMAEAFAVADFATFELGVPVPAELEYQPAMGGPDTESPLWETLGEAHVAWATDLVKDLEDPEFRAAYEAELERLMNGADE